MLGLRPLWWRDSSVERHKGRQSGREKLLTCRLKKCHVSVSSVEARYSIDSFGAKLQPYQFGKLFVGLLECTRVVNSVVRHFLYFGYITDADGLLNQVHGAVERRGVCD